MHIDKLPENDRFLHLFTSSDSVSAHLNIFFVYFVVLIKLKTMDEEELMAMPMGRTLHRLACAMHLMEK